MKAKKAKRKKQCCGCKTAENSSQQATCKNQKNPKTEHYTRKKQQAQKQVLLNQQKPSSASEPSNQRHKKSRTPPKLPHLSQQAILGVPTPLIKEAGRTLKSCNRPIPREHLNIINNFTIIFNYRIKNSIIPRIQIVQRTACQIIQ